MSRTFTLIALAVAIAFQFVVLCGEYVNAALPLWIGKEIRIAAIPVDPRSLFRGNYARLRYDISRIELPPSLPDQKIRRDETVYVSLRESENGLYVYESVALEPPETGLYLRGRNRSRRYVSSAAPLIVEYGIEAFFAPKNKALALEKELRNGGVALLMVMENGKAALKDVIPKEEREK